MSFATDLWGCFEFVNTHSLERRKGTEELMHFFKELASSEEAYAKGLERVGTHPHMVTTQGTLAHAVAAFKQDCIKRATHSKTLAENITKDLVESLREMLKNQAFSIKKFSAEGKSLEKQRGTLLSQLEKCRLRYMKACSDNEQITYLLESGMTADKRTKLISRLVSSKKELDESVIAYQSSVEASNTFKERYDGMMAKVLEAYQRQEENRLEVMKDSLRKFVVYETSQMRNVQYDLEALSRAVESVNTKVDLLQFIDTHSSDKHDTGAYTFEPYKGTHPAFKNLGSSTPISTIPHAPDANLGAQTYESWSKEMDELIEKAWIGEEFSTRGYMTFNLMAKENLGRQVFCESLEKRRTEGRLLTEATFLKIAELMLAVLNESERHRDYRTAKSCVDLSQTLRNEEDQPLQKLVQGHTVWRNPELWDNVLRVSIDEEIRQQEKYGLSNLSVEEVTSRLQNAVFCQLGTFASILQSFKVDFNFAGEILSRYAFKYQLSVTDFNTLEAILNKCYQVPLPTESTPIRGVPTWVQDLEGQAKDLQRRTDALSERMKKHEEVETEEVNRSPEHTDPEGSIEPQSDVLEESPNAICEVVSEDDSAAKIEDEAKAEDELHDAEILPSEPKLGEPAPEEHKLGEWLAKSEESSD
mmetsp:Transcript_27525/g.49625  ORF Transcript_27525/g.49625 Transcript_27525/m.49625 type:complete len:644 (-) Transcript_27525:1369-3300(-)